MSATITAVPGVHAAHWTHASGTTGCTVFTFPSGARGGVAIPGHATGTRELDVLKPDHVAGRVDAICLSGGSAFGLATCDGVARVLEGKGVGFDTGFGRVPIVCGAVLFDLATARGRPDAASGEAAALAASSSALQNGRFGAGAGAHVAKAAGIPIPGGFASLAAPVGRWNVGAAVALNAYGSVRDPETGRWLTAEPKAPVVSGGSWAANTTLAVVATDAPLDRAQCGIVADMATAAFARTLYPAFSAYDGDVVFCVSTAPPAPVTGDEINWLGHQAADLLARAIVRVLA
jgi:L-aminopeptidase/D-esterase-like protein